MNRLRHLVMGTAACGALVVGCTTNADRYDRKHVSPGIEERTGFVLGPESAAGTTSIPPNVVVADGITTDEAIAIALWNNPTFLQALSELGVKRADVVQAGLLTNPQFNLLFPVASKQVASTLIAPLEALWLRGSRVAVAELECERVSQLLVRGGLDLIRQVQLAAIAAETARQRAALSDERRQLQQRLLDFHKARLRSGATSQLVVTSARNELLASLQRARQASQQADLATDQLRAAIGFDIEQRAHSFMFLQEEPDETALDQRQLLQQAIASRPDLRAAQLLIEQEAERAGLAKAEALRISGIWEVYKTGGQGFESGPGIRWFPPIFDWGQGRAAAATARLDRAARSFWTIRQQIATDVIQAHQRVSNARRNLARWQQEIVPALQAAGDVAKRTVEAGHTTLLPLLQQNGLLLDAREQALQAKADLMQAYAQLEWSVGRKLNTPTTP